MKIYQERQYKSVDMAFAAIISIFLALPEELLQTRLAAGDIQFAVT
jgi:hypothetical protein